MANSSAFERGARFSRLLAVHQRRISLFVLAAVPSPSDADDIIQDTYEVLWRRFDEFDETGDFGAWAVGIARMKLLKHWGSKKQAVLPLDPKLLSVLADEAGERAAELDDARYDLDQCLGELTDRSRKILHMRYAGDQRAPRIAEALGVSHQALYKALRKIHDQLLDCMRRVQAEGGGR